MYKTGRGGGGDALISQCQTVGRAHSLLSLGPREPPPHPAGARWGLGGAGRWDRGEENDPIFGRGPLPQSAQGKVLGHGEEPGTQFLVGGQGPLHCGESEN